MNTKRILSAILASAMVTSLSLASFASTPAVPGGSEVSSDLTGDITGTVAQPAIFMTLPVIDANTVMFDLYNQLGNGQQVISANLEFVNHSVVPVSVKMNEYTITPTTATLTATLPAAVQTGTDNNLFLWLNPATYGADGAPVYGAYDTAVHSKLLFTSLAGSAEQPADFIVPTKLARGTKANLKSDGTIERVVIPAATLGTTNKLTVRFDGAMNTNATWADGEAIKIVPVFEIVPEIFTGVNGTANVVAQTGAIPTSATIKAGTGSIIITPATGTLKATAAITAADYTITCAAADGTAKVVTTTLHTVATGKLTLKPKVLNAVKGDVFTITVNASAFTEPDTLDSAPITVTLAA